jgi:membrane protease YdiL (CAAX protease family)
MAVFVGLTFVPGGPFLKTVNTAEGMSKLMAVAPWAALFVLSNAFMEELLFRGILLQRYEALTGKWLALFSTALVFALAHVQVNYAANVWQFVLMVFGLGLMWGLLMQRSKSIWGSVLFHAGADVAIILPIYQAMGS